MTVKEYLDFELEAEDVRTDAEGVLHFSVRVFSSPAGEGKRTPRQFPPTLNKRLSQLERRELDVPGIMEVGEALGELLLPEEARDLFTRSLDMLKKGQGLRLRLRLDPALAHVPWEFIYVQRAGGEKDCTGFLALNSRISIARHEAAPIPGDFDTTPRRRRVLAALSCPEEPGFTPLDLARERENLRSALRGIPGIDLDIIEDATASGLRRGLRAGADIFHFAGHGVFSPTGLGEELGSITGEGAVVLAGEGGKAAPMPAEELAVYLGNQGVQLVVLGGCQTGRRDGLNVWSGVAAALMEAGVPAAVAMQYAIRDEAAIEFNRAFYEELAAGAPLDQAVTSGRIAVFSLCNSKRDDPDLGIYWRDWAVPVLYLRAKEDFFMPAGEGEPASPTRQGVIKKEKGKDGVKRAILGLIVLIALALTGLFIREVFQGGLLLGIRVFVGALFILFFIYCIREGRRLDISERKRTLRVFGVATVVIVVSTLALGTVLHKAAIAYYNKGLAFYAQGQYDEAIESYDKALTVDDKLVAAYVGKGKALYYLGKYEDAKNSYDEALKIDENLVAAHVGKGNALYYLGKYEDAKNSYDDALKIDDELVEAYVGKGNTLHELRKYDEAIKFYDIALKIDARDANAHYGKGLALYAQEQYDQAIDSFKDALNINNKLVDAYVCIGNALYELERYEDAIKSYEKAIDINPAYAEAYKYEGDAFYQLEKYEDAIKSYKKAIDINPAYADAHIDKGNALNGLREYEAAVEWYDKALKIDPAYAATYNNRGNALYGLREYEAALEWYDKAIKIDPELVAAHFGKGNALYELGRYEAAVESYDKALKIDPAYAYAYNNKGAALYGLQRYGAGLDSYDKAIKIDPAYAVAYSNRGNALYGLREYDAAVEWYDKALEIDRELVAAYIGRALAFYELGKYEEARNSCDKAIAVEPEVVGCYIIRYILGIAAGFYDTALLQKALEIEDRAWPYPALRYFTSKISEADFLAEAGTDPGRLCDAHCYIGYVYKAAGKPEQAENHFRAAVATGRVSSAEYSLAVRELERLRK